MDKKKTNILIVDDHKLFGQGLSSLIKSIRHYHIVGVIDHGDEVVGKIQSLTQMNIPVSIVILDFEIPGECGVKLVKHIKKISPITAVIILSMHNRFDIINELYESGISGYLLKNMSFNELETALELVQNGKTYFSQDIIEVLMSNPMDTSSKKNEIVLTTREKEVLNLIVKGCKTLEIGKLLFISKYTVETHRKNLLSKLKVHNSPELVKRAFELQLI